MSPAPSAAELPAEAAIAVIAGRSAPLDQAALPLLDAGVARGDGAFETVGVWGGAPFRLDDHLDRLGRSLAALALPDPDWPAIRRDVEVALRPAAGSDAALRIAVTASGTTVVSLAPLPDRPALRSLCTQPAPWIQPVDVAPGAGAKSLSYGSNMAATRRAHLAGAQDALLVSVPDALVLEGPTFAVLLVADGVVLAPEVPLGIVDSISRRSLLEIATAAGIEVRHGRWPAARLADVDEVVVSSSLRPATAVAEVDRRPLPSDAPVAALLDAHLQQRRRASSEPTPASGEGP